MTLEAGVNAGVSIAEGTGAPLLAWEDMEMCEDGICGGELLER